MGWWRARGFGVGSVCVSGGLGGVVVVLWLWGGGGWRFLCRCVPYAQDSQRCKLNLEKMRLKPEIKNGCKLCVVRSLKHPTTLSKLNHS